MEAVVPINVTILAFVVGTVFGIGLGLVLTCEGFKRGWLRTGT